MRSDFYVLPAQTRIGLLRKRMYDALKEADKADATWNRLNDELNLRIAATRKQRAGQGRRLSAREANQYKADDVDLSDAFGVQSWWRNQTTMLAEVLQAEIAYARARGELP
jgi:hypothetical protein